MGKFHNSERTLVKNLIATLSINRLTDNEIIQEIEKQTGKTITQRALYDIKQSIKKDSYEWYTKLRSNQYEYLHEFKERINEILWLQKKHNEIINSDKEPTAIKQASLIELHKLNITLANYYDVAPEIINGITLSKTPKENEIISSEQEQSESESTAWI